MKVLVVEDDPTIGKMMGTLLRRRGIPNSVVESGEKAVEAWERGEFDVILMDIQMPGMDGLEATRAIREKEKERGEHVPIIAMTAHTMEEDRRDCRDAGMDGYISKPVVFDELLTLLATHFPALITT